MHWIATAACGALALSFLPLAAVAAGGRADPWLFNLLLCTSGIPVLLGALGFSSPSGFRAFLAAFLRDLRRPVFAPALVLCALGSLDWALFAWAVSLGSPAAVVVLSRLAPLVVVAAVALLRRQPLPPAAWAAAAVLALGGALASAATVPGAAGVQPVLVPALLGLACSCLTACLYFTPSTIVPRLSVPGASSRPLRVVLGISLVQTTLGALVSLPFWLAFGSHPVPAAFDVGWVLLACLPAHLGGVLLRWVACSAPTALPSALGALSGPFALAWLVAFTAAGEALRPAFVAASAVLLLLGLLLLSFSTRRMR